MGTRNRKKKDDDKKPAGDGGNDSGADSPGAAKKAKAQVCDTTCVLDGMAPCLECLPGVSPHQPHK